MTTSLSRRTRRSGSWRAAMSVSALAATTLLVPAFTPSALAAEGDSKQQLQAYCDNSGEEVELASTSGAVQTNFPRGLHGAPGSAFAEATQLTAKASSIKSWPGEDQAGFGYDSCNTDARFQQLLTVAPGTSGLAPGTPVTLRATVDFAGRLSSSLSDTTPSDALADVFAELVVDDLDAECVPDVEGGCYVQKAVQYVVDGHREHYSMDSSWSMPAGYVYRYQTWDWTVRGNKIDGSLSESYEDEGYLCEAFPCTVVSPPGTGSGLLVEPGTKVVDFDTTVGATLRVDGFVDTFIGMANGPNTATSDAADGLRASVTGLPGSGVEVLLGTDAEGPSDITAPTVDLTSAPAANGAGWNSTDVTVSYAATDEEGGSGVAQLVRSATGAHPIASAVVPGSSGSDVISTEGVTQVQVAAQDVAGNTSDATTRTVRIDKTAPVVTATAPAPAVAGAEGTALVDYTATATDALDAAPALSCTLPSGSAFPVGTTPVTCTATDHAGNSAAQSFDVVVTAAPGGESAAEQIDAIATTLHEMDVKKGVRTSLLAHLQPIRNSLEPAPHRSCGLLDKLVAKIDQQTGKGLDAPEAADLRARTTQLAATLDC